MFLYLQPPVHDDLPWLLPWLNLWRDGVALQATMRPVREQTASKCFADAAAHLRWICAPLPGATRGLYMTVARHPDSIGSRALGTRFQTCQAMSHLFHFAIRLPRQSPSLYIGKNIESLCLAAEGGVDARSSVQRVLLKPMSWHSVAHCIVDVG